MHWPAKQIACLILLFALVYAAAPAAYGTGVRAYVPTVRSATADTLPFIYNGSFIVYNDGPRDGVYIIRVGVTEPASINWLNLSEAMFTLKPGQSKLVYFTFNITSENTKPGDQEFIFTPTLLTPNVEPYLDDFANYISSADSFRFRLNVTGTVAAEEVTPITFIQSNRTNFVQYSVLTENNSVVTQLDRAIKLNLPDKATVGENVPISTSIFESLSNKGISMLAVSPQGLVYPISEGNFTFNSIGLWGVVVLVGDEMVLGRTIDISATQSPLAGIDTGTILAGLSLLILLSIVPLWLMTPVARRRDPYDDVIFKAHVVQKYLDRFDKARLQRAVQLLWDEYSALAGQGVRGKKDEALADINELTTLAYME